MDLLWGCIRAITRVGSLNLPHLYEAFYKGGVRLLICTIIRYPKRKLYPPASPMYTGSLATSPSVFYHRNFQSRDERFLLPIMFEVATIAAKV